MCLSSTPIMLFITPVYIGRPHNERKFEHNHVVCQVAHTAIDT